MAFFEVSVKLG